MSLLDNFIRNYDKDHYKRNPKALISIRIVYAILFIILILGIIRAIKMIWL